MSYLLDTNVISEPKQIDYIDFVPSIEQSRDQNAAHVTSTAGNQNVHRFTPPFRLPLSINR